MIAYDFIYKKLIALRYFRCAIGVTALNLKQLYFKKKGERWSYYRPCDMCFFVILCFCINSATWSITNKQEHHAVLPGLCHASPGTKLV